MDYLGHKGKGIVPTISYSAKEKDRPNTYFWVVSSLNKTKIYNLKFPCNYYNYYKQIIPVQIYKMLQNVLIESHMKKQRLYKEHFCNILLYNMWCKIKTIAIYTHIHLEAAVRVNVKVHLVILKLLNLFKVSNRNFYF